MNADAGSRADGRGPGARSIWLTGLSGAGKSTVARLVAAELAHFTGVSDPYEEPLDPEIVLDTEAQTPEQSAATVLAFLDERGVLLDDHPSNGCTDRSRVGATGSRLADGERGGV